jgi:Family of unknown function (DUF5683)
MTKYITLLLLFFALNINAQNIDSTRIVQDSLKKPNPPLSKTKKDSFFTPNPKKALLYSIIPGGGQIYNRKVLYIRLPAVIGAMGGTIYYTNWSSKRYKLLKTAYFNKVNGAKLPAGVPETIAADYLKKLRDSYFKRTQQAYAFVGVAYLLTAAEAFTTAHLLNFDVSEDISMKLKPNFQNMPYGTAVGVGLAFTF